MPSLPSPTSSPSLKPAEIVSVQSRKRQRSQSMQSETSSSSPKRSVSECPSHDSGVRSPPPDELPPPPPSDRDNDIDAYMAEQDHAYDPGASALAPFPVQNGIPSSLPPPEDKLALIKRLCAKQMQVGDTWYLVSRQWYKRWQMACTGEVDKEGPVEEKDLGPVNNSSLVDKDGNLIYSFVEGVDVEYVPQEVWSYFITWYGEPVHPLPRKVIARGITQEPSLELHRPLFKVLTLSDDLSSDTITGPPAPIISLSSKDSVKTLFRHLAGAFPSHAGLPYRIWQIEAEDVEGSIFPPSKILANNGALIRETNMSIEDFAIRSGDIFVVEFKKGAEWISHGDTTSVVKIDAPPPLFSFSQLSKASSSSSSKPTTAVLNHVMTKLSPANLVGSSGFGISNARSKPQEPGTLGLGNMGNTCFMNSALQCLAHTKELAEYFLTGVFQDELNTDNPLGMGGAIAESFGVLMQRIWSTESISSSYSPREFKMQLQRFAPQFIGYQQHDSQELVAFLLDGLHEDLNRVLKKPYVEKPDWEGGGNMELISLARKSWEGYMMRNDSVIVDLFQGQYQSTLVCPECQKVSITFDPFMYLTLPLPVQKKWRHTVYYVPWDSEKPHTKVPVEIGGDASFKDLRNLLGRWMDAIPDNLLMLEIFNHRFYKYLDDSLPCGEMLDNDIIVCYELPCPAKNGRHHKKQPDDTFILPVFLYDLNQSRAGFTRNPVLFGYPTIAVVNKDQATNVDLIYDAVVERLQRWTDNARDLYTWEARTPSSLDGMSFQDSPLTSSSSEAEQDDIVPAVEAEAAVSEMNQSSPESSPDGHPTRIGTKKGIFNLCLQANYKEYGTALHGYGSLNQRFVPWEIREDGPLDVLLRENDALFCEFDENMKAYYFGDDLTRWDHARWNAWEQFIHPEYEAATQASAEKKNKGISIQDCLDEFTKEEQLGEDDLWYCPRCKKHQQATKKFDLWKAPDVLVVHLKRFSNSRTMRDKIDTFVDFPITGLDLEGRVGERRVTKELLAQGLDIEELGLSNPDEPLIYDLFGVDEHLGGLGGGHYRAYALNHISERWYHFDDSYVTPAQPTEAVNANAYLLFYRRRTTRSLGGKTAESIEQARLKPPAASPEFEPITIDTQLPTPPEEATAIGGVTNHTGKFKDRDDVFGPPRPPESDGWPIPRVNLSNAGSIGSSPPQLDDIELPNFEDSHPFEDTSTLNTLFMGSQHYEFPDPSSKASPTSSNEAEPDLDDDPDEDTWRADLNRPFLSTIRDTSSEVSFPHEDMMMDWSRVDSPTGSAASDPNPFADANEKGEAGDDNGERDDRILHTPSP